MRIIKADVLGMCFGVRDALAVLDRVERPGEVAIHGEIVHNELVLERLHSRGFQQVRESSRRPLPLAGTVAITAHGVSERERHRLQQAGKELLDTTCPLVRRAHDAAQRLAKAGRHLLVIGKRGHVEVQGIVEDLASFDIVESPEDVIEYPHWKLGIMCQTTTPVRLAAAVRQAVEAKNPDADIVFADTICAPTKDHQKALEALLDEAQTVVVIGGRNSNNTRQLVLRCEERGVPAHHVQHASELRRDWFTHVDVVGLTAGTSTLPETIDEVYEALLEMSEEIDASMAEAVANPLGY